MKCECNMHCSHATHTVDIYSKDKWPVCTSEQAIGYVTSCTNGEIFPEPMCWPCGKTRLDFEAGYRGWLPIRYREFYKKDWLK